MIVTERNCKQSTTFVTNLFQFVHDFQMNCNHVFVSCIFAVLNRDLADTAPVQHRPQYAGSVHVRLEPGAAFNTAVSNRGT